MQELKDRILKDGQVIGNSVLKVDSFLNHQIDPEFIMRMGRQFAEKFAADKVTKVLTVEASGIAVAMAAALALKVPVVFAKKKPALTQQGALYSAEVYSFTRQEAVHIIVEKQFLNDKDVVVIIDDFLAHGEALSGLADIIRQAGARLAGAGIVIEKRFQGGGQKLRESGIRIEALASIRYMEPGRIEFAE